MKILAFLAALLFAVPALAQGVGPVAPIPSEVVPFNPTGQAALTAGVTSTRVALPSNGKTAVIRNNGAVTAFLAFGNVTVAATVNAYPLPAGTSISYNMFPVTQPAAYTYVAAITASSSAILSITTGSGQPFISGGVSSTVISGTANVNVTQVGGNTVAGDLPSMATVPVTTYALPSYSIGSVFDPFGNSISKTITPWGDNLPVSGIPAAGMVGYEPIGGVWDRVQVGTAGELKVTGTVTATPSGTQDTNLTQIGGNAITTTLPVSGLGVTNIDNVTPVATGASISQSNLMGFDGANWDRLGNASGQSAGVVNPSRALNVQLFGRTTDVSSMAIQSVGNNVDVVAASTAGNLAVNNYDNTFDQVSNSWVRTRYPTVSTTNSSATPLGGGAVFTGTSIPTIGYGSSTITVFSNVASATNGLSIQQSSDGTNWDIADTYTVAAGVASKINVPRQAYFLRVVYTNGAGAQGSFRLQTLLNTQMPVASSLRPVNGMSLENDFAGVLSVPMLSNGTTLDIGRSILNSNNSNGTGIVASGLMAQFDDTAPSTITENNFGNLRMSADHSMLTSVQNSYAHISTATTTTVKSGAGTLKSIIVNSLGTVASTTTVYDSTTGSGTVIAVINTLALSGTLTYDIQFITGLTLVTTGTVAPDITVSYK